MVAGTRSLACFKSLARRRFWREMYSWPVPKADWRHGSEQLQLAEAEIRKLIDYLISNLPSFFKERLAVGCCES
jgi:hypothetical protein